MRSRMVRSATVAKCSLSTTRTPNNIQHRSSSSHTHNVKLRFSVEGRNDIIGSRRHAIRRTVLSPTAFDALPLRLSFHRMHRSYSTRASSGGGLLTDTFNRHHNYLRISLTERCNLRCVYCMPEEGVELTPHSDLLTTDEIIRLANLFVKAGVDKIRLTGGEPTVRKDVEEVVERLNGLRSIGLKTIAMTSNALALHRKLPKLKAAGLNALNISLDTLDEAKFERIARRPGLNQVLKSIHTALDIGISPLKINCVVMRGVNDDEVLDFVRWTKDWPLHVRFIEYMPFQGGGHWNDAKIMTMHDMVTLIRTKYPTFERKAEEDELNLTARTYSVPGWPGRIGFISSMSDHFCSSCNRVRLLADGSLKACLFGASEISLRDALRTGQSDQHLEQLIHSAIQRKKASHDGMHQIDQNKSANRPMILIGG
eukprot:TRINITY_DN738_c0_g2_i1.p2 TRINITY_DN738_c0_g2~~TRINITY_DN738_c0_g2_i1.p2  ORF type:complete len:426 (-),score=28.37 TRINITY_DN738_c0_g2_i1:350-1627(-)